jgi:hypothetical protein
LPTRDTPGVQATQDTEVHQIHLEVVKLPETKEGFVLPPRRWVVECFVEFIV